jgi:50S ribosomal protein L16 3-hydroxylase
MKAGDKLALLGGISISTFFREYWQKKPLLIRAAIPGFKPLLPRESLFSLAKKEEVESRLITGCDEAWSLQHGPFSSLPSLQQKAWTLLVQGVNLHHRAVDELLNQFRFVPDTRLDDVMISFATEGGGVGPHVDSYDVFLLQAKGRRRWRISAQKDLSLVEGVPLKILAHFEPEQEWVLEPGDMLYLPPQYAHEGVAMGECMTYSVGFRSATYQELGEQFLQFMQEEIELPGRYIDPDRQFSAFPAKIDSLMLDRVSQALDEIRFDRNNYLLFLGTYLTEPKITVYFDSVARPLSFHKFIDKASEVGVTISSKTKMLYSGDYIFINGESFIVQKDDKKSMYNLANMRCLMGGEFKTMSEDVAQAIYQWYQEGWLYFSKKK